MADHRDHTHSFLFITTSLMYSTEWQPLPLSITNIGGNTEDDCSLPPPIPEFDFQGLILSVLCFLFSNLEARMWDGSLISKTKQNKTIDIVPVKDERRSLETESGRIWVYQLPAHPIPPPPPLPGPLTSYSSFRYPQTRNFRSVLLVLNTQSKASYHPRRVHILQRQPQDFQPEWFPGKPL